jgi:hypothetical protein
MAYPGISMACAVPAAIVVPWGFIEGAFALAYPSASSILSYPDASTIHSPNFRPLYPVYEGREGDTFEAGWRNKVIWGDNLLVIGSLLEKFGGRVDLVYIDPPFLTGADFSYIAPVGEGDLTIERRRPQ